MILIYKMLGSLLSISLFSFFFLPSLHGALDQVVFCRIVSRLKPASYNCLHQLVLHQIKDACHCFSGSISAGTGLERSDIAGSGSHLPAAQSDVHYCTVIVLEPWTNIYS